MTESAESTRARLALKEPLRGLVLARPLMFSFAEIQDDETREDLDKLQQRYLTLRELFLSGTKPTEFRIAYKRDRIPVNLTVADGLMRLAWILPRIHKTLSSHATGWINDRNQPQRFSTDNPELYPEELDAEAAAAGAVDAAADPTD